MPLTISDDVLRQTGMSMEEARVEIACRLFDAGKLALWPAAQLAEMPRGQFEEELTRRHIPVYRPTPAELQSDLETLRDLEKKQ